MHKCTQLFIRSSEGLIPIADKSCPPELTLDTTNCACEDLSGVGQGLIKMKNV